ncbi:hypothetical protein [Microbacterium abyssi]|uniref:hypothetical protein n=1 Tax=Microbacterium abyssi TaxID=2782166 RepID=UPI00188883C8|nr:hypothetical protein [Microbacterium sp. A18JL241]
MGLFSQRKDEENTWAALPGEPRDQDAADVLDAASTVDPLTVGLGAQYTSIVFPVAPPAPEAAEASDAAPKDPLAEEPDPHVLGPGLLPTPFTADQIRDAARGGKTIRMLVEEPDGSTRFRVNRFRDPDDEGAMLERWTSGPTGIVEGEITSSRVTWRELQGHAAFPADLTTLSSETLKLPIGRVECLRYEVRESADAEPDTFWFATAHPGMPVRYETHPEASSETALRGRDAGNSAASHPRNAVSARGDGVQRTTVIAIERP